MIKVVLIADRTNCPSEDLDLNTNRLEMISDEYFNEIIFGLNRIRGVSQVIHYHSPKEFIENITHHKNDLVFTIFGGSGSRNRMALVPAICEAYNIMFVGADAYARIVCQDKYLSKALCRRYGLVTPAGVLVEKPSDVAQIELINLPIVVKPNFEGSSIGITDNSPCHSYEAARTLTLHLLSSFNQPILVEQFVGGKEVSICLAGNKADEILMQAIEIFPKDNEQYFDDHLMTASLKHYSDVEISYRCLSDTPNEVQLARASELYGALGKLDYMRVDCKLVNNQFTIIELTPDAYLGMDSSFSHLFASQGIPYEEGLALIMNSALKYYQNPFANGKGNKGLYLG